MCSSLKTAALEELTDAEYEELLRYNGKRAAGGSLVAYDQHRMAWLQARYNEHGAAWWRTSRFMSCPDGARHDLVDVDLLTGRCIGAVCRNCDHVRLSQGEQAMRDNERLPQPDPFWLLLTNRTWLQLRAAVYVAKNTLEAEAESSRDAREALVSMARILSDEWDGREGEPDAGPS